jgi:tRNA U38,U39,U40 pseudouridine synthase TruA
MVRSLVAILLEVGRGALGPASVDPMLVAGRRALDGRAAPARGLTLERVVYESKRGSRVAGAGTAGEPGMTGRKSSAGAEQEART